MIKHFLIRSILALSLLNVISNNAEASEQPLSTKKREFTALDRWNEIKRQAAVATGTLNAPAVPRHVERVGKPEIIIKGSKIFFDGKFLEFGRPLNFWKNILKRNPQCDKTGVKWCVWSDLGLEVFTREKDNFGVSTIAIMLSIPEDLLNETSTPYPDGTPDNLPTPDWLAKHPFTGYLEIDGFGIDKDTKFWELQSKIAPNRNMHCGLRSCEFPGGSFGPGSVIDLHLNGTSESATIEEIKIYTTSY